MIVYDITSAKSFENVKNWIKNIEENASEDVELMLLGNKCDMEDSRVVSKEQGEKVCNFVAYLYPFTYTRYATVSIRGIKNIHNYKQEKFSRFTKLHFWKFANLGLMTWVHSCFVVIHLQRGIKQP